MRLMLDTSVLIEIEHQNPVIEARLYDYRPHDVAMSVIALTEPQVGVEKGTLKAKNRARLAAMVKEFNPLPFDQRAARAAAKLLAAHDVKGNRTGTFDLLIAAHAHSLGVPVAYRDGDFDRFGVKKELWPDS